MFELECLMEIPAGKERGITGRVPPAPPLLQNTTSLSQSMALPGYVETSEHSREPFESAVRHLWP